MTPCFLLHIYADEPHVLARGYHVGGLVKIRIRECLLYQSQLLQSLIFINFQLNVELERAHKVSYFVDDWL